MPGDRTPASVVIPTSGRPDYLEVALRSIAPLAHRDGAEVIVVYDGSGDPAQTRAVAERHGARVVVHEIPRGLNAARNSGMEAARAELIVFTDDDVEAPAGWLAALLDAARRYPDTDVFAGPIRVRLEGRTPHSCGREPPPVTSLDLGDDDCEADFAWGANMTVRRSAFERFGPFDATLPFYGEEETWQRRLKAGGGRVRYVAAAGIVHRRAPADATLRALARAAHGRGRAARRYDVRRGEAPTLTRELRTFAGCAWHTVRRRCENGILMAADSAGRLREALRPTPNPADPDFLSGQSGVVAGKRTVLYALADIALDARALATAQPLRLARAARAAPRRRVLVLGVDRPELGGLMDAARAELERSRHELELALAPALPGHGKFENLNAQLAEHPAEGHDWVLVIDDDVELPRGFLDRFLFLAERFDLRLAQPAHRRRSHAAWKVMRRRGGSVARATQFVEIGPVTALHAETFPALLPFPPLRMGWGLDAHWGALARERGWKLGVIDALPVRHALREVASEYPREEAVAEGREFLARRPYMPRDEAQRTLVRHRSW